MIRINFLKKSESKVTHPPKVPRMTFGVICILSVVCIIFLIFLVCITRSSGGENTRQEGNDALPEVSQCKQLRHLNVHGTASLAPAVHLFPGILVTMERVGSEDNENHSRNC
jgi:hypothetical protein